MVIRARVRARLLGLHLLTLDAYVTAGNENLPPAVLPPPRQAGIADRPSLAGQPAALHAGSDDSSSQPRRGEPRRRGHSGSSAPGSTVARARQLVDEGARALDEVRPPAE
jgi:hypothetical protein